MHTKAFNLTLLLTSLLGYLEWGTDSHSFLFQAEWEVISKLFTHPMEALHPFTVLPMLGQILLLLTLFQKQPGKIMTLTGLGCIGILMLLICFIGCISLNYKMILSTLPFLVTGVLVIRQYWKKRPATA